MQCDLDVDFEMPCDPDTGFVDDTLETIEADGAMPKGYGSWEILAERMRDAAKRVWKDWKGTK